MNCPVCKRSLAPTLSICFACGAMVNDSVREELQTKIAAPARSMSRQGSQTYLGSVPDMAATGVVGMRLMGVRPDSPADKGGMKTGDVIIEFGGTAVKDLYSYTDALYAHQPGDVVKVVVMRDGKRVELSVTLGKRGG